MPLDHHRSLRVRREQEGKTTHMTRLPELEAVDLHLGRRIRGPSMKKENSGHTSSLTGDDNSQRPSALAATLAVSASASCIKKEGTKACGRN